MDLINKYLGEADGSKKFMHGYVTHNNKIKVTMYRSGKGMKGPFVMDVTDVKSNKSEEKEFSSEREMKAYWSKIHKANLK
jgi:hypothetical protein